MTRPPAMGQGAGRPRRVERPWGLLAACVVLLFVLLYWGYPFRGMVISDSWFLYLTDGKPWAWWTNSQLLNAVGLDMLEAPRTPLEWSSLWTRRGLIPALILVVNRASIGHPQIFVNTLCIGVQLANLALFARILKQLGGTWWALPAVLCAAVYPFASASHFWQILIVNNLSVTFFLVSLVLFLRMDLTARTCSASGVVSVAGSMACLWISMLLVDYAVFMGPLYLCLALRDPHGRRLLRVPGWRSPAVVIGGAFVGMSLAVALLFSRDAPSALIYLPRFEELAARVRLPAHVLVVAATLANGAFFYLAAFLSNSAGVVLYPLAWMGRHAGKLLADGWALAGIAAVAALIAVALVGWLRAHSRRLQSDEERRRARWLLTVGALWAFLGYLPFAVSFGYPRIVGLTADRANILALWGVALCLGVVFQRACLRLAVGSARQALALGVTVWLFAGMLIANLYLQKTCYVEGYRKERQMAELVLQSPEVRPADGRVPLVLLEREQHVRFPRAQLLDALQTPGVSPKASGLARFLVRRYFVQEPVSSSFHLEGIMLFGCCPQSAPLTFDSYARMFRRERVPVYKEEWPLQVRQDPVTYQLAYENTAVWSKEFMAVRPASYPKDRYRLVRVKLDETCFQLGGVCTHRIVFDEGEPQG